MSGISPAAALAIDGSADSDTTSLRSRSFVSPSAAGGISQSRFLRESKLPASKLRGDLHDVLRRNTRLIEIHALSNVTGR